MSCFLALECSTPEGSLALVESDKKQIKCLVFKKWLSESRGKHLGNTHSDRLLMEVDQALNSSRRQFQDFKFLAVGVGPGRWTGVRTAVNVTRALSFALDIPVYPVNSLRIMAEQAFLKSFSPVFVAINGFKNQVYFAEFYSQQDREGKVSLLGFQAFCEEMEKKLSVFKTQPLTCISDLEDFYSLPPKLKKDCSFRKVCPSAWDLAQIVFQQKVKRIPKKWKEIQAFYLRNP